MAGDGTLATTAIITGGLTCGHGPLGECRHGIITSPFSLYCVTPSIVKPPAEAGGPYPCEAWNKLDPGEVQNFYQPVPEEYYMVPRDKEEEYLRRYKKLKITLKFGNIVAEKEYLVPEKRRRVIVEAFNLADATRKRISLMVEGVKKITKDIIIRGSKFRLRK